MTTTTLLQRLCEAQNQAAWHEIDARFRPLVLALGRRMGLSDDDASEVAQESLIQFYRDYQAGKYSRERGPLRAWLIGIARNRVGDLRRRRVGQRGQRGDSVLNTLPDEAELSRIWEIEARKTLMARALTELERTSKLSPRTFHAFRLHVLGHRTPAEVAAELRVSVRAVYLAKHRCLKRLREILAVLTESYELV